LKGLGGELLGRIQRKSHHQKLGLAAAGQGRNAPGVLLRAETPQGWKGSHGDTEGIAACQTDALSTHIKGEG
jgi:hypothetical protein